MHMLPKSFVFPFSVALAVAACLLLSCQPARRQSELLWQQSFFLIGSQSSPRASDLNQDGVLDLVMGAGTEEIAHTEQGVLALDGKSGNLLWQQPTSAHITGSATFYDLTGDGVEEVFIGGRVQNLKAINGKTGELIWEYAYQYEDDPVLKYARFNFYNSVLVPDQNQDGLPDLLTVNGGNWLAPAGDSLHRYPGLLMLFDLKTGAILAADTMPDGRESYMSPVCFPPDSAGGVRILVGTGGETAGGRLYLTTLADLMASRLEAARVLAASATHGFIAPPVLADFNGDGHLDIAAVSHDMQIFALDGQRLQLLWKQQLPGAECSNSFALGHFNDDGLPDLFTLASRGSWPKNTTSYQLMLDGATGQWLYLDSLG
ncbi:MAG: hypothetical protein D6730_14190, partial [Bacteroidetes bacterium]